MHAEHLHPSETADQPPRPRDDVDREWLDEHLNMEIALRAYERGVADPALGPTDIARHVTPEKMEILQARITVRHRDGAEFPLTDQELLETLMIFPESWLHHARLQTITIRPPALFVTRRYGETTYFIAGIQEEKEGKPMVNNGKNAMDAETAYAKDPLLSPPVSPWHYAPGQYVGSEDDMLLFQEPDVVRENIGVDARRQYGRELLVHEFLHAVLREDADHHFRIDGEPRDYAALMREFHEICQREPAAASEYSELYQPWGLAPFNPEDNLQQMALQEEMGELLSGTLLGWGCTPQGQPRRINDRDFAGIALHERGCSEKAAFAARLLRGVVVAGKVPQAEDIQGGTAARVQETMENASE